MRGAYRRTVLALFLLLVIPLSFFFILWGTYRVETTKLVIRSKKIPEEFDGFTIVQLSDIHIREIGDRERKSIEIIKEVKPDLIVITGDLLDNKDMEKTAVKYLTELGSIAPVLIVYGNWEHSSGINLEDIAKQAIKTNVLVNSWMEIARDGDKIVVVGVDDPYTGYSDLGKAMEGLGNESFTILLAHSPEIIGEAAGKVDLVLTGHTHGGQIVIPFIGPLFIPLPEEYRKYVSGTFNVNSTILHVSRGLGTSIIPVRFLCPPEVTIIVLEREG